MSRQKNAERIQYYDSFQDDLVETADQSYTLPADYVWIRTGFFHRAARVVLYFLCRVFARIYTAAALHMKVVRSVNLRAFRKTGAVVFGNHTQPVGDAFIPLRVCAPKRCYVVVSPANLGLPVLGSMLPAMGALPIPSSPRATKTFLGAIRRRLREGNCVVVYPESHVWPYYTEIRPFPSTSFSFAVQNHVPAFCMTVTYQSRRRGDRPKATVFLDGPFFSDTTLSEREQKEQLRNAVFAQMQARSRESTCQYIEYRPRRTEAHRKE